MMFLLTLCSKILAGHQLNISSGKKQQRWPMKHWTHLMRRRLDHAQLSFGCFVEKKRAAIPQWIVTSEPSGAIGSEWARGLSGCAGWASSWRTWSWGRCMSMRWRHSEALRSCGFQASRAGTRCPRWFLRVEDALGLEGTWRWLRWA